MNPPGHFTTAVASQSCQQVIGKQRPIVGYWVGNALSFSVIYPVCGSVVSIVGNFYHHKKTIQTFAIISHQLADKRSKNFAVRYLVHDTYTQIK